MFAHKILIKFPVHRLDTQKPRQINRQIPYLTAIGRYSIAIVLAARPLHELVAFLVNE